jgi:hypothetical protein
MTCTAVLVSPKVLLTAAHCLVGPKYDLRPAWNISGPSLVVERVEWDRAYDGKVPGNGHDIAVVLLRPPVGIPPAKLNKSSDIALGQEIRMVGYGARDTSDDGSGTDQNSHLGALNRAFIFPAEQNVTCPEDSGAPLFMTINGMDKIVGLVVSAPGSCRRKIYATNVASYLPFISRYVNTFVVESWFLDLLNQRADPRALLYWTAQLDLGVPRPNVLRLLMQTKAYRNRLIDDAYRMLLGRTPGPDEYGRFTANARSIWISVAALPEFIERSCNGDVDAYVARLHQEFLGRNASAGEIAYWRGEYQRQGGRQVASRIIGGDEAIRWEVKRAYFAFLRHGPDDAADGYVNAMRSHSNEEALYIPMLGGDEYKENIANQRTDN